MKLSQNMHVKPDPDGSEIDPRYGVEKRRVPTGPNPLHHWSIKISSQVNIFVKERKEMAR